MEFPSVIKTDRLVLERPQPITFDLAKMLFDVVEKSRDHLKAFLPWVNKTLTPEDEFGYLKDYVDKRWNEQNGFCYFIYTADTHEFLGTIDLLHIEYEHKAAEIGFWLGIHAIGHGYMLEAVKALEKEAFAHDFHRIIIRNDTDNTKSANVAKNAGYHLDGIMRENRIYPDTGRFYSTNVWSKLKGELD